MCGVYGVYCVTRCIACAAVVSPPLTLIQGLHYYLLNTQLGLFVLCRVVETRFLWKCSTLLMPSHPHILHTSEWNMGDQVIWIWHHQGIRKHFRRSPLLRSTHMEPQEDNLQVSILSCSVMCLKCYCYSIWLRCTMMCTTCSCYNHRTLALNAFSVFKSLPTL